MEMVFAMFTILAGCAYILWQFHKENRGLITCIIIVVVCFGAIMLVVHGIGEINRDVGAIIAFILLFAALAGGVYAILNSKKWAKEESQESSRIWDEVYKLPIPDKDVLNQYKLANNIPLVPENVKSYDDAAIQCWRIDEYNKRFRKKHKLVFYHKT